jgi:hypothetical protein
LSLVVPADAIIAKCKLFADAQHSPYRVRSTVSPDVFRIFASAIRGESIDITSGNITDLTHLSDEFSFIDLQRELSACALSSLLSCERQCFLSDFEDHQDHMSRLQRLISNGFEASVSRKMLILTAGDLDLSRSALSCLSQNPSEMSKFASSIPIQKCSNGDTLLNLVQGKRISRRGPFQLIFDSAGGDLYSMTSNDCWEYSRCLALVFALSQHPIGSDPLLGCQDTMRDFYMEQWRENADHEAVLIMEGFSETAARKLMVLARGRYNLAWRYVCGFGQAARPTLERGVVFSGMENRDELVRSICASQDGLRRFVTLAKSFFRASAVASIEDPGSITLLACQDAREFLHRNRQLLERVPDS